MGAGVDVRTWLEGLGLETYAEAFDDNDIDGATLPAGTAEDLKDGGVASVGHRRKLLVDNKNAVLANRHADITRGLHLHQVNSIAHRRYFQFPLHSPALPGDWIDQ